MSEQDPIETYILQKIAALNSCPPMDGTIPGFQKTWADLYADMNRELEEQLRRYREMKAKASECHHTPWAKAQELASLLTLARGSGEDTIGRVTSGNYPYYAHKANSGPHRKGTQVVRARKVTPPHADLCMWNNPTSPGKHGQ